MLHILLLLFWVVCPATLLLAGWRVAVPYAYSGSTVVYISGYECASAILVFVCVFLVMGIGIRASRVISEQRWVSHQSGAGRECGKGTPGGLARF